jgi:hypothetical protein
MSVKGMNEVAVQRDLGQPQRVVEQPPKAEEFKETKETKAQGYADLLITAIPTEPLALYTFVIGGIIATVGDTGDKRLTMRWIVFGVTAAFIALWMLVNYLRKAAQDEKEHRALPLPELGASVVAFGAWGLAMPESPLMAELSGSDRTIWTVLIVAAGVALLGLLTGNLRKPSKKADANAAQTEGTSADNPDDGNGGSDGLFAATGAALVAAADAFSARRASRAGRR